MAHSMNGMIKSLLYPLFIKQHAGSGRLSYATLCDGWSGRVAVSYLYVLDFL